ncbi:MAG: hypothetical protein KC777_00620 [Cyanobacteria bacterium HKST-UBA02]|nr:hypothetical protein [Cyanobacteria bacterium HKST-UBA02]
MRRIALPIIASCVLAGLLAPFAQADYKLRHRYHPELFTAPPTVKKSGQDSTQPAISNSASRNSEKLYQDVEEIGEEIESAVRSEFVKLADRDFEGRQYCKISLMMGRSSKIQNISTDAFSKDPGFDYLAKKAVLSLDQKSFRFPEGLGQPCKIKFELNFAMREGQKCIVNCRSHILYPVPVTCWRKRSEQKTPGEAPQVPAISPYPPTWK